MLRGFLSRSVVLGCLIILATGVRADELESRDPQGSFVAQGVRSGAAEALGTRALTGRRRAGDCPVCSPFEQPPQKVDLFQLGQLKRLEAENRERFRKRLALPSGAVATQSAIEHSSPVEQSPAAQPADAGQAPKDDSLCQRFLIALLILAVGLLAVHKFAPEFKR